jgi:hypothetical protein
MLLDAEKLLSGRTLPYYFSCGKFLRYKIPLQNKKNKIKKTCRYFHRNEFKGFVFWIFCVVWKKLF